MSDLNRFPGEQIAELLTLDEIHRDECDSLRVLLLGVVCQNNRGLSNYRKGGAAALGVYRDKGKPSFIAEEFELLLENSPYIIEYRPELHRCLLQYPNATLAGAGDFLYWGEYDFGAKPVVRMSHVTIYLLEKG